MSVHPSRPAEPSPAAPAGPPQSGRLPLLLVALILLAFGRLALCEFVTLDDGMNIYANGRLNPPTVETVLDFWNEPLTGAAGLYIPVTYTIWAVLAKATWVPTPDEINSHLDARVFHTFNVLAHAMTAWLVFSLLNRLLRRPWAAFVGAAFFALHPLQVESVGWVSGLKDVLCGLFAIAALNQYVSAAQLDLGPPKPTAGGRRTLWRYLTGLFFFVIAMLCKPTAMVTPALVFVVDWWVLRRPPRHVLRWIIPWVVVAAPFAVIARVVQNVQNIPNAALWARPIVAGDALAFYLWKMVATYPLVFDYNLPPHILLQKFTARVAWLVPLVLAVIAWRRRRKEPRLWAALLLFVIPLLPNSGLATFQYMYYSVVADHYVYTAMLGPALLVAWAVDRFYRHRLLWVACAAGLAVLALRTAFQTAVWRDTFSMTKYSITHNPYGFMAHGNLGVDYDDRAKQLLIDANLARVEGKPVEAGQLVLQAREAARRAREEYVTSARLKPDGPLAWVNLVSLDLRIRNDDAAFEEGRALVKFVGLQPRHALPLVVSVFKNLSMQAYDDGLYEDSLYFLERALELKPNDPEFVTALKPLQAQVAAMKNHPATTRATSGPTTR